MDAEDFEQEHYLPSDRTRARRRITLVIALSLAACVALIWWQRVTIAEHFVQQQLAARNVRATYTMAQIAFRTQRIENLVLGDPARPDLTARSVEIDIDYNAFMPKVSAVRARGVRLFGKVDEAGVHLGELDKFRDPSSDAPFSLPEIILTLDDARARLATPAGDVGLSLNGRGALQDGFAGKLGAVIRNAAYAGCRTPSASAYLSFRIEKGAPLFNGPLRSDALRCEMGRGDAGAAKIAVLADVALNKELTRFSGTLKGGAQAARGAGATLVSPSVDIRFDGTKAGLSGQADLRLAALRHAGARIGSTQITGGWKWTASQSAAAKADFETDAQFDLRQVRAFDAAAFASLVRSTSATPVGPLAARLARGLASLQQDNRLEGKAQIRWLSGGKGNVVVPALALSARRGENVGLASGSRFLLSMPDGRWRLEGGLSGGGGDLPEFAMRLRAAEGGGLSGQMFLQPYEADGARLDLDTVRFLAAADGSTQITTQLRLDGPLPDGELRGLNVPLTARIDRLGNWSVNPGCTPVAFRHLKASSLTLDSRRLSLCAGNGGALLASRGGAVGGGGTIRQLDLTGRLGENPMRLTAGSATVSVARGDIALDAAELLLGDRASPVRLAASNVEGHMVAGGFGGELTGVEAKIASVPLLIQDGRANWGYAQQALSLKGRILVLDDANPDRFNPVESQDFTLRMADGRINATGSLNLPGNPRKIAAVRIVHTLGNGVGQADFDVDGLRFDSQLQPDQLTFLALGVVANVDGTVDGKGRIAWQGSKVTSTGSFATNGMNLAAAFGPVRGLSTRITFTDLLGLVTEPGQEARIATVHPGIEVHDGVIHYQLLPDYRVAVENGRWPLAGGELSLLPTVLDMSAERSRALTFRVLGLQAGAFIDLLELENVNATGTFDGLLPMIFDAQGGRIVGGVLAARQIGGAPLVINHVEGLTIPCDPNRQGGHLAYVGQVSNENLGMTGKLAFDALKDLQYKCLTILMDGALDGEIVTQVIFNGINRGELSSVPKVIAKQFVGLPFLFNVRIEAPFRGLMSTAQSFIDPSLLIRDQLGTELKAEGQNGVVVKPRESEDMLNRETK